MVRGAGASCSRPYLPRGTGTVLAAHEFAMVNEN
ncbi:hypothetical protein Ae406Ps2_2201 [Pseudonocardia sp. Ae406_Ps2]|nr:hypothetical protein Ae406Ps2_2201 [Pseudonocardia sp. Ae406_Ps2]OLM06016.1 hypothetical protein Ae331Ps2_3726c [Pseudonocardia sp. Ae331_Ps2]OLM15333.1 hypothetical protein Ae505Ps2_5465 [Pseudonocardia sp. Ae505_Ps2]OLM23773.1 hypothetical protein Ae706Ps2_2206 [Pseudonocardia sp. Ae706_Ps2]